MPQDEIKNAVEHNELKSSVKAIQTQIGNSTELQNVVLANIESVVKDTLQQTKLTNGRVTKLEELTDVIRILNERKWLLGVTIMGLFKFYEMIDIEYLLNKLINFIL